jgi:hypothetical protein
MGVSILNNVFDWPLMTLLVDVDSDSDEEDEEIYHGTDEPSTPMPVSEGVNAYGDRRWLFNFSSDGWIR